MRTGEIGEGFSPQTILEMENKESRKREIFLIDYIVSTVNYLFSLFFSGLNNVILSFQLACQEHFHLHRGRKKHSPCWGFMGKKKERRSCISVASLARGEH